jgi:basic membrane protein A
MVIDSGGENDRSFNQYSLEGARSAADAAALDFSYVTAQTTSDYERHIETLIEGDADFIITNGFRMGVATANAARRYPDVHFVTTDTAFFPGAGCPETVTDCYDEEGGLVNVTSLVFAEDEVGYLAGVLAACMSETGIIASIAGVELPPVVRFVVGYQTGAQTHNADITTLNQYIPDFNDPSTGNVVAQDFINQGADVIFGVGGNTGNGGLLAAHEAGLMAIGVDVDQYFSYPEIQSALLSSAAKNIDRATAAVVEDFAAGELNAGIRIANLSNGGVGLAPFHDWEDQIPQDCLDAVEEAENAIIADPTVTGAKDE